MEQQRPSVRLLYAWWTVLFCTVILLCLAASLLSVFSDTLWYAVTGGLLAVFSVLFAWYLPARYRSIRYSVTHDLVVVRCGVLVVSERFLYVKNIQFSSVEASVFDALFGLGTIRLRSAGAALLLYGLDKTARQCVREMLPALFRDQG
ncbi:MAG: PH domain-containing protein [Acetanaerobacterium sp.]